MGRDLKRLTEPIIRHFPEQLREIIEPPTFFYEVPYTDDYYSAIKAMLMDPHIHSQLLLRKYAVLSAEIGFEGDEKAIEIVKEALSEINLQSDLMDLLSFLEYGWTVSEVIWKKENIWKVQSIEKREYEHFRFNSKGELLYKEESGWKKAPPYKFIYLVRNSTPENPYGESILKPIYYAWKLKLLAFNFWEVMMEKYAIPPLAVIAETDSEENLKKLTEALALIESSASATFTGIKDIKPIEVGDKTEVFKELIELCNKEISKAITGQVLGSEVGDHGSYALAKIHKDMFLYVVKSDAKLLEHKLNITLIPWILELNGVQGKCRISFTFKEELEFDKLVQLIDRGFPVSKTALYERYGVPKPADEKDTFIKPDIGMAFSNPEKLRLSFSNAYEDIFEGL